MSDDRLEQLRTALAPAYELDRELGRGGMATVYLARDRKHGRNAALKVLRPDVAAAMNRWRFLREITTAARLAHPHIVPLFDSGEAGDYLYFTMPYVDGESLRACLAREGRLTVGAALAIAREATDALAYAHAHGVVHRDVKPENLLLTGEHALVADFGIARAVAQAGGGTFTGHGTERLTEAGFVLGTAAYISPEQATGDEVDGRSDVYSLACVLYEMLAGVPPFTGETTSAVIRGHLTKPVPRVRARRPDVPVIVEDALIRALAKNPDERYASARAFGAALAAAALLESPGGVPSGHTTRQFRRRWRVPGAALGAIVLGAIALVAAGLVARRAHAHPPAEPRVLVAAFDNATGDSALAPVGRMAAGWITERLGETGMVQVVDVRSALVASAADPARGARPGTPASVDWLRTLANATGANVVVWGSYYRTGDSLRVEAHVADATDGRVLRSIEPVSAPVATPFVAVERARERVTGAITSLYNPRVSALLQQARTPPTYAAYRETLEGYGLLARRDFAGSTRHLLHAFALDTTYPHPLIVAAFNLVSLGQRAAADSLVARATAVPERLSPADLRLADIAGGWARGEFERALVGARALRELTPGSEADMLIGEAAFRAAHLHEAADALARVDPDRGWMKGWANFANFPAAVYHILGDHDRAVATAEAGARRFPGVQVSYLTLALAYAGAGRVPDVERAAATALATPDSVELTAGDVLWMAARELRVHGHGAEGQRMAERMLAWYRQRPSALRQSVPGRLVLARALYRAARRGDRREAARWDDSLAALSAADLLGGPTRARAVTAALLGDRDRAAALYRQAFTEGLEHTLLDHCDDDLMAVRAYPPFVAVVRTRD